MKTQSDDGTPNYLPAPGMIPKIVTSDGTKIPLSKLLRIDPDGLVQEYELQAPWVAVIQFEYGKVELAVERKERQIKEVEAATLTRTRDRMRLGTKVPNEATLKAAVVSNEEVKELYQELFSLKDTLNALNAARLAFSVRKDMLVSLGAEVRLDRKSM